MSDVREALNNLESAGRPFGDDMPPDPITLAIELKPMIGYLKFSTGGLDAIIPSKFGQLHITSTGSLDGSLILYVRGVEPGNTNIYDCEDRRIENWPEHGYSYEITWQAALQALLNHLDAGVDLKALVEEYNQQQAGKEKPKERLDDYKEQFRDLISNNEDDEDDDEDDDWEEDDDELQ